MENFTFITTCQNGKKIFERPFTILKSGIQYDIFVKALSQLSLTEEFHKEIVDMKYIVGTNSCVPITKDDEIVYVLRKGKKGPTPMVKNRNPLKCSFLTIVLKQIKPFDYLLVSICVGEESELEPWDFKFYNQYTWEKWEDIDEESYQKCLHFWTTHALIYDEADIALQLSI